MEFIENIMPLADVKERWNCEFWFLIQLNVKMYTVVQTRKNGSSISGICYRIDNDVLNKISTYGVHCYNTEDDFIEETEEDIYLSRKDAEICEQEHKILLWEPIVDDSTPEEAEEKRVAKANAKKEMKTAERWSDSLSTAVKVAVYCLKQHKETGKTVTEKDIDAEVLRLKAYPMLINARRAFRAAMPEEVLHR